MQRGEVWWAELAGPASTRPVVLLSRNEAYAVRELVIVVPVTTRIRRIPSEVELGPGDGLPKRCAANLDTIITVAKAGLKARVAMLTPHKVAAVDGGLKFALGLR
jgi:mRNA interferase MazF